MIRVENIKKSFGGVESIKGSTFAIAPQQVTALIGPNGAGKTTLFDIIGGYIRPDAGEIYLNGEDITGKSSHAIANRGVSRTFQQVRLFKYLSILDHLLMTRSHRDTRLFANMFRTEKIDRGYYEKRLKDFGIERDLDAPVSDLSYGQRKLLDILLSLEQKHTLLMFDEPMAGVNNLLQQRIEGVLLGLKEKKETILLIDHDMNFIRKLSDHVIVLDAGVVLTEGKPDDVLKDPRVLEAYLGE